MASTIPQAAQQQPPPQQLSLQAIHQTAYHPHHHNIISSQANYISVPQMAVSSQAFQPSAAGTFVSMPMTTVIQHRVAAAQQGAGVAAHRPAPACSVTAPANFTTNFYVQTPAAHPHSHTPAPVPAPTPTPAPTPAPTPTPQAAPASGGGQGNAASSCSLAKLQQLTNGLEAIPQNTCGTMTPPPPVDLTPPPPVPSAHHPHAAMTPPPAATHQMMQQQAVRNLPTPPAAVPNIQTQMTLAAANYYKYHQSNVNVSNLGAAVAPPVATTGGRTSRTPAGTGVATVQQMQATPARVSPNVTINPNLVAAAGYGTLNGYRMTAQQTPGTVAGYITNTAAAGFINQAQIPMQMGVMNMAQTQYQDPAAIQRAAQQNTMYTTYGYINGSIMQPLNGTMRR